MYHHFNAFFYRKCKLHQVLLLQKVQHSVRRERKHNLPEAGTPGTGKTSAPRAPTKNGKEKDSPPSQDSHRNFGSSDCIFRCSVHGSGRQSHLKPHVT